MGFKTRKFIAAWFFSVFLVFAAVTGAYAYSGILAFGDSLSDNGQADGVGWIRMSDGPVWVDYLAEDYGLSATYLNLAFSGATSYYNNPAGSTYSPLLANTGLLSQVQMIDSISSTTLVTVWAGGNDMLNYMTDPELYNPVLAAGRVGDAIEILFGKGGRNFIVPNLSYNYMDPNDPEDASAIAWMQIFNVFLAQELLTLDQFQGVNIHGIDLTQLWYTDLDLSNTITATGSIIGPDGRPYANFDSVHPSSAAHRQIASYVRAQVPEPASILLLILGFAGLAGLRRKMK